MHEYNASERQLRAAAVLGAAFPDVLALLLCLSIDISPQQYAATSFWRNCLSTLLGLCDSARQFNYCFQVPVLLAVWAQFKSLFFPLSGRTSGKHIDMCCRRSLWASLALVVCLQKAEREGERREGRAVVLTVFLLCICIVMRNVPFSCVYWIKLKFYMALEESAQRLQLSCALNWPVDHRAPSFVSVSRNLTRYDCLCWRPSMRQSTRTEKQSNPLMRIQIYEDILLVFSSMAKLTLPSNYLESTAVNAT